MRVKWWNLTKENAVRLAEKIKSEASWEVTEDADCLLYTSPSPRD